MKKFMMGMLFVAMIGLGGCCKKKCSIKKCCHKCKTEQCCCKGHKDKCCGMCNK